MKKIMFFIPRMGGGGAERVVANLANEFDKRGDKIIIYTPTDNKSFYKLNDSIKIIGENYSVSKKKIIRQIVIGINGIRLWFAYSKRIRMEKPDVVISFLTETNLIALSHNHKKYKLIASERNDPTQKNIIMQRIIRKLYSRADVLVCQSKIIAKYYGSSNVEVIPNPIDNSILPNYYLEERRKVIVGVGRLMNQKNFSNLITAFSLLPTSFREFTLEIYGDGVQRSKLETLIKSLNLQKRVKLMGAQKNVLELINDSSLFVMSSDYEGYPNALAEAMAVGLPVICTDFYSGTARELIGDNNGLIVPVGDSMAMAQAIVNILTNSEKREVMSKENLKIRDRLSINNIADMWYQVMKSNRSI